MYIPVARVLIVYPGSEFVDNIMMSPSFWNLPRPGLIISVTGNAEEFAEEKELIAHHQPYVLFRVTWPPVDVYYVPVRKARRDCNCRDCNSSQKDDPQSVHEAGCKRISTRKDDSQSVHEAGCIHHSTLKDDSLWEVLYRIADYMSPSPEYFMKQGKSLAQLAKSLKNKKRVGESHNLTVEFKVVCDCRTVICFSISSEDTTGAESNFENIERRFKKFMNELNYFRFGLYVDVEVLGHSAVPSPPADPKNVSDEYRSLQFKIISLIEGDDILENTKNPPLIEGDDAKKNEGKPPLHLDVSFFTDKKSEDSESFEDLQRRIENLSLFPFIGGVERLAPLEEPAVFGNRLLTLPQPIWMKSTAILYHDEKKGSECKKLFSEVEFEAFKNNKEFSKDKTFYLLRTQGAGCNLSGAVIERILHQVVFLLPLQFGTVWIITGGTNKGIMKVACALIAICLICSLLSFSFVARCSRRYLAMARITFQNFRKWC